MELIKRLLHKAELGLRIVAKLLLLVPLLLAMAYTSFAIDPAGTFRTQPDVLEVEANALLAGQNLTGYDQMAERKIMALYVQNLEEPVETIALGSSRILQLRQDMVGTSFYNCGMSGGDFYDLLGNYYLFERADKLPDTVILSLDPWLLYDSEDAYYYESDEDLYLEFLTLSLGMDVGYEPTEEIDNSLGARVQRGEFDALFDPAYFQASLEFYRDMPEVEERQPTVVEGDLYTQSSNVKLSDGSVLYKEAFREASQTEVNRQADIQAGTFMRLDNYVAPDETLCAIFDAYIKRMESQGVNVVFMLVPFHPMVFNYATEKAGEYPGFFLTMDWYIEYAEKNDIPLYGHYNPFILGLTEEDFYDGMHIRTEALAKIFPGMQTVEKDKARGRAGSSWQYRDDKVQYKVAQRLVAERYETDGPDRELRRGEEDVTIHGSECYLLEWHGPLEGETEVVLLAQFAVTKDEGIIYRLDTENDIWVVDNRY